MVAYGSSIWGKEKPCHAEIIQNKACRYFLGVHNFTPIPALQGDMGWLPVKHRKCLNMLRFWNRLLHMPNDRLTKQVFNAEYHLKYDNWSTKISEIFSLLKLSKLFDNREPCNISQCEELFHQIAEEEWKKAVNNKPKLRTYQSFKDNLNPADYFKYNLSKYDRSILAKFRSGILQLRVETGRYTQTKLEERICQLCDENTIEDEFHFLCICQKYDSPRTSMYQTIVRKHNHFTDLAPKEQFRFLMSNCSGEVIKYLKKAWVIRQQHLYKPN